MDRMRSVLILVLAMGTVVMAQSRHPVTGRVIAPVMSVEGHRWLDRSEREAEEEPTKAIEALAIRPGMVVADVGAGSGYYTMRLAVKVGPSGRVFATDVQRGMLDLIERRVAAASVRHVTTILGSAEDPGLPAGALDLILMVDVYHELESPQTFMRRLRTALKPDGRLVLLEFRKEDPKVPIRQEHKMTVDEVRRELTADGYVFDRVIGGLPWQHILVFTVK
ncbi:MAG: class I SAM-dependent methyltransferase [Vicinamibacterales bacterium]